MTQTVFEDIERRTSSDIETSFRYNGSVYTIATTDISHLRIMQDIVDSQNGYIGKRGNYETMLFIDGESIIYPFGDLPGHPRLGVFQRYGTEDEARGGHQEFVSKVKQILLSREQANA